MENQQFRSGDLISLLALVGVVTAIVVSIVTNGFQNQKENNAEREMARLAQQILSDEMTPFLSENSTDGRTPATAKPLKPLEVLGNEGQIAKDPWGKPYLYRVYQNDHKVLGVVLWSFGPNNRADTQLGTSPHQVFAGDDLGIFQPVQ